MKTSENKPLKNAIGQYNILFNRIRSAHSFGKIKTWNDFLLATGMTQEHIDYAYYDNHIQLHSVISWKTIKDYMEGMLWQIQHSYQENHHKDEQTNGEDKVEELKGLAHEYEGESYDPTNSKSELRNLEVQKGDKDIQLQSELREESVELSPSPKEKATLFYFQKKATLELLTNITERGDRANLLLAAAGLGKTFIFGAFIRRIYDSGWIHLQSYSPWPVVVITRASIVTQTERVLQEYFGLDTINEVIVVNIEQMRSRFGEMFVNEKTVIKNGEESIEFVWRKNVFPKVLIIDECQSVKNTSSIQSQIFQAFNEIESKHTFQVYVSATPFTKVSEAQCFSVATHLKSERCGSLFRESSILTNKNWKQFAINVAAPSDPIKHSPSAVEKLMKELLPYVVDVKGVRSQFHAENSIEMIHFETEADRLFYLDAWNRWQREKAKLEKLAESGSVGNTGMAILAAFTKFRQAAELCRANILARRAFEKISAGKAAVIACCFKTTITKIVNILVRHYHIPRSKISLIWGGKTEGKAKSLKKKEIREKLEKHKDFLEELAKIGGSMEELGLSSSDIAELMDEEAERINKEAAGSDLGLGIQSKKQRQEEIDRFQRGDSDICIFTFKAGGVGLSLHHSDDLLDRKVKRKADSNWAYEEDIKNIPTEPRDVDLTPTYSAIEMVQGLGRAPRLTSLSNTKQTVLFFLDTIEVDVAHSVSLKLKCLKKVVRQKESWEQIILDPTGYKRIVSVPSEDDIKEGSDLIDSRMEEEDEDE